jgi:iron complex outermembrane receptor protein
MKNTQVITPLGLLFSLCSIGSCLAGSPDDATALSSPFGSDTDVLITPTRLKQATADIPAAVTLITSDTIRRLGLTRLVDILRLVPGMEVVEADSTDVRVSYHGTNISNPRRMNVLVDGISMYQPALATVDWTSLPIPVSDIDRIEVTRGTDSATYGPDSMLAIINIVSKHPSDAAPLSLTASGGSPGTLIATIRGGGEFGSTSARAAVEQEEQHGFDTNSLQPTNARSPADDYANTRLSIRTSTALAERQTLETFGYAVSSTQTQVYSNPGQITAPNSHSQSFDLGLKWNVEISDHNSLQTAASYSRFISSQGWRSCLPALVLLPQLRALYAVDPSYATDILDGIVPTGGTAEANALALQTIAAIRALGPAATARTCADASIDVGQGRADGEIQDTYVFGPALRAVWGVGAREDYASSQTLLDNGTRFDTESYRVFGTAEYVPVTPVRVNVGAYYEHDSLDEDSFSPRIAVNWSPTSGSTFRAILADGTRAPNMFEQAARQEYVVHNVSPAFEGSSTATFFETANGPGHLKDEQIVNRELGYLLEVPSAGLQLDVKVFDDSLYHLISEKLELSSFLPTNDGRVKLRGAELQATGTPNADWQWRATYAYLDNYDASTPLEQTEYSRHSGSLALSRTYAAGWRWSVADYGATGNGIGQRGYERADTTLGRAWILYGKAMSLDLTGSYYFTLTSSYYRDVDSIAMSSYNNRFRILATVRVEL